jgi:hypothetical protein
MAGAASNFPFDYDVLAIPRPGDFEDIVKHSDQHASANNGLMAVQHYIGRLNDLTSTTVTGKLALHQADLTQHSSGRLLNSVVLQSPLALTGGTFAGATVPSTPVAIPELSIGLQVSTRPFFLELMVDSLNCNAIAAGEMQYFGIRDMTTGSAVALPQESWKSVPPTTDYRSYYLKWGPITAPSGNRNYRLYWTHTNSARTCNIYASTPNALIPGSLIVLNAVES